MEAIFAISSSDNETTVIAVEVVPLRLRAKVYYFKQSEGSSNLVFSALKLSKQTLTS